MKVANPDSSQSVVDQNQKPTVSWFTFWHDTWAAIRGGIGISIGGTLSINTTSVGNMGGGEDDLMTYTLGSDLMSTEGDEIYIKAWGKFAANANNKTIKLKFGGQTILTTGAIAANDGSWRIEANILRKTISTQEIEADIISSNTSVVTSSTRTAGTQDLSASNIIKLTGEATSTDDIVQYAMVIKFTPNT